MIDRLLDIFQYRFSLLGIAALLLCSCVARPTVEKLDAKVQLKQDEEIEQKIITVAGTGDWLVTRGYHATDNLVVNGTGVPLSHVGLFNAESKQVIEAEGVGVHFTDLKEFVSKSYRLLIVRPRWRSEDNAAKAWENAQRLVGKEYDFLGTVGFNFPERYYCSELAVRVYSDWFSGKERFPGVIKPGELYLYGRVMYDSLPRDEL
jgi:uncharacterized protein YycO